MKRPSDGAGAEAGSLDGRWFRSAKAAGQGEVTPDTMFQYHQDGQVVWARYEGGPIVLGFLVGTRAGNELRFRYSQINDRGQTANGACTAEIVQLENGRLRLNEDWVWESRVGRGTSAVEEVGPGSG